MVEKESYIHSQSASLIFRTSRLTGTATVPAGMSGKTMVATVEYPVEGWLKDDDKVNVPNTDEGGELIQKVLDAYNKKVTAESQYNLKVIKKKCAGDYTEYDVKGMKAKKVSLLKRKGSGRGCRLNCNGALTPTTNFTTVRMVPGMGERSREGLGRHQEEVDE